MSGSPIGVIVGLLALCVILLLIGIALRRRGVLRSRGAWLVWSIITILPLFGAGLFLFGKHQVERAQGLENAQAVPSSGPIPN